MHVSTTLTIFSYSLLFTHKRFIQNYLFLNFDNNLILFIHHPPILVTRVDINEIKIELSTSFWSLICAIRLLLDPCKLPWIRIRSQRLLTLLIHPYNNHFVKNNSCIFFIVLLTIKNCVECQ